MELVGPQYETSNIFFSTTLRVMKFTEAPEDPEHTLHTIRLLPYLGPENSFASIFGRSLAFSVPKYFANKGLQTFGQKISNMRSF